MRNIKGGYQIINFKNIPINGQVRNVIKGIYEKIEKSNRKPLLFSGIFNDTNGLKIGDIFVNLMHTTIDTKNAYYCKVFITNDEGEYLVINEDDEIYIKEII